MIFNSLWGSSLNVSSEAQLLSKRPQTGRNRSGLIARFFALAVLTVLLHRILMASLLEQIGQVQIPQEAFISVLRTDKD